MGFFSSIGINIISSIIYDIGKSFIANNQKPLSEEQILQIIDKFNCDIKCIFEKLNQIEDNINCVKNQNEIIFKLLLLIFDNNSDVTISSSKYGYIIDGDYTLNNLNSIAKECLERYAFSLPTAPPKSLSEAIWPIPHNLKGELLDELENNLYNEEF